MSQTTIQNRAEHAPNQTDSQPVIRLRDVSKTFEHNLSRFKSFKEMVLQSVSLHPFEYTQTNALDGISIDVQKGEAIGVVGHNGSGKTTLLNLIAGVTKHTSGRIEVRGRVVALTDLYAGFSLDLSGMENIFLCAALVGISRKDVFPLLDDIQDFAGLDEFVYTPVKNYSSGMLIRLAFSIAVHFSPDVLLLDEILACGDREFQQQSIHRVREMKRHGVTIFFVSHRIELVEMIADRIIWLQNGRIHKDDETTEIVKSWMGEKAAFFNHRPTGGVDWRRASLVENVREGSGEAWIENVRILNHEYEDTFKFKEAEPLVADIDIDTQQRCESIEFIIVIQREDAAYAYHYASHWDNFVLENHEGKATVRLEVDHHLADGVYYLGFGICPVGAAHSQLFDFIRIHKFWVESDRPSKMPRLYAFPTRIKWSSRRNPA